MSNNAHIPYNPDGLTDPKVLDYYFGEPASVTELRQSKTGEFPRPAINNPVLGYLLDEAQSMANDPEAGVVEALTWLAVHAWMEGACAAESRHATDDPTPSPRSQVLEIAQRLGVSEATARKHADASLRHLAKMHRAMVQGEPDED